MASKEQKEQAVAKTTTTETTEASITSSMAGLAVSEPAAAPTSTSPPAPPVASLAAAFTAEEKAAFAQVTAVLLSKEGGGLDASQVRPREVALVTMLSKARVDKAVEKYKQFVATLAEYELTVASLYEQHSTLHTKLAHKWATSYQVCGVDNGGRSIMWIGSSEPTLVEEERTVVHAGVMYWMAVHSDITTLREGCTFVIDTSKQGAMGKVGNERKLQKTWQALPLRPQNLFIVGAGFVKRMFINALIKFASVFSNSKVLGRVRFVQMPEVHKEVPSTNMPHEYGGAVRCGVEEWVTARLSAYAGVEATEATL